MILNIQQYIALKNKTLFVLQIQEVVVLGCKYYLNYFLHNMFAKISYC